jgi:hypothetical protein
MTAPKSCSNTWRKVSLPRLRVALRIATMLAVVKFPVAVTLTMHSRDCKPRPLWTLLPWHRFLDSTHRSQATYGRKCACTYAGTVGSQARIQPVHKTGIKTG